MFDVIFADAIWDLVLIAGVLFLSGFGLGALAHHMIWGSTQKRR